MLFFRFFAAVALAAAGTAHADSCADQRARARAACPPDSLCVPAPCAWDARDSTGWPPQTVTVQQPPAPPSGSTPITTAPAADCLLAGSRTSDAADGVDSWQCMSQSAGAQGPMQRSKSAAVADCNAAAVCGGVAPIDSCDGVAAPRVVDDSCLYDSRRGYRSNQGQERVFYLSPGTHGRTQVATYFRRSCTGAATGDGQAAGQWTFICDRGTWRSQTQPGTSCQVESAGGAC